MSGMIEILNCFFNASAFTVSLGGKLYNFQSNLIKFLNVLNFSYWISTNFCLKMKRIRQHIFPLSSKDIVWYTLVVTTWTQNSPKLCNIGSWLRIHQIFRPKIDVRPKNYEIDKELKKWEQMENLGKLSRRLVAFKPLFVVILLWMYIWNTLKMTILSIKYFTDLLWLGIKSTLDEFLR